MSPTFDRGMEWRDVPGYEGLYQVSFDGRVKSMGRTTIGGCRGGVCWKRYPSRVLTPLTGGKRARARVHLYKLTTGSKKEYVTVYIFDLVRSTFGDQIAKSIPAIQKQRKTV